MQHEVMCASLAAAYLTMAIISHIVCRPGSGPHLCLSHTPLNRQSPLSTPIVFFSVLRPEFAMCDVEGIFVVKDDCLSQCPPKWSVPAGSERMKQVQKDRPTTRTV